MLVLTRKLNETIVIDGGIRITLVGINGNKVRLGIEAPESIRVDREEVAERAFQGAGCDDYPVAYQHVAR